MINLKVDLLSIKSKKDGESAYNRILESEMFDNIAILHDRRSSMGLETQFNAFLKESVKFNFSNFRMPTDLDLMRPFIRMVSSIYFDPIKMIPAYE